MRLAQKWAFYWCSNSLAWGDYNELRFDNTFCYVIWMFALKITGMQRKKVEWIAQSN